MTELETAKQRIRDLETQLDGLARSDMRYCKKAGELQAKIEQLEAALREIRDTEVSGETKGLMAKQALQEKPNG